MTLTLTVFDRSPDRGRGLGRDTRIRWALEELGLPYTIRPASFSALKEAPHLARNPFGQIPTLEDGPVALFESGAIVLHLAGAYPGLLPTNPAARARALSWVFAAIGTVEPPIVEASMAGLLEGDMPWADARLPLIQANIRKRLAQLADALGDGPWLDGDFSAGDLMMISVLQRQSGSAPWDEFPALHAYVARGEARPAYARAFAAQRDWNLRP